MRSGTSFIEALRYAIDAAQVEALEGEAVTRVAPAAPDGRDGQDAEDTAMLDWLDANPKVIIRSGKQHIRPLIRAAMKRGE